MAKGISVHVGVNKPDPSFQMAELRGCANDAMAMQGIAVAHGFESLTVLTNESATFEAVKVAIKEAAGRLHKDDIFLFTFSGHGSTQALLPTVNVPDEPDHQDETILLFDCILIDNYLRRVLWSKFDAGVRILGVADCCHAGSVLFAFNFTEAFATGATSAGLVAEVVTAGFVAANLSSVMHADDVGMGAAGSSPRLREFTGADRNRIIASSPDIHDVISNELLSEGKEPRATILTLAACRDDEKAIDGDDNGVFTKAMLEVLASENPPNNYDELMSRITENLIAKHIVGQHPTRFPRNNPDPDFLAQSPFSIETP
jgi:hypothetical protein